MADFVGVTAFSVPDLDETKQQALLFDRIAIPGLSIAQVGGGGLSESESAELCWLSDQGVLTEATLAANSDQLNVLRQVESLFVDQPNFFTRCVAEQMRNALRIDAVALETNTPLGYRRYIAEPLTDRDYLVRACCRPLHEDLAILTRRTGAFRGRSTGQAMLAGLRGAARRASDVDGLVVDIVLKNFPSAARETSWEKILEVRRDSELAQARMALRRWMKTVAKGSFSAIEIEQEIDYLLGAYTASR